MPSSLDSLEEIQAWCEENGYTEPEKIEGRWWAYPPNGVMRVPVEGENRLDLMGRIAEEFRRITLLHELLPDSEPLSIEDRLIRMPSINPSSVRVINAEEGTVVYTAVTDYYEVENVPISIKLTLVQREPCDNQEDGNH